MSILITGSTGQVGFELVKTYKDSGKHVLTPSRQELNLANLKAVQAYLERHQPELVINAAAYTAVDQAEAEPERAKILNAGLPELLAQYCQKNRRWLVHYSSDYVYQGTGTTPWQETDPAEPLNTYGETKLAGDQAIQAHSERHLILRTSWVYSNRGRNFLNTMLVLAGQRNELTLVDDQHGAPTPAWFIADVTQQLLKQETSPGIYHLAPAGEATWCRFAEAIFEQVAELQKPQSGGYKKPSLVPIPSSDYPTPAKRPLNSRLDLTKLERALGDRLPDWQALLIETLKDRQL